MCDDIINEWLGFSNNQLKLLSPILFIIVDMCVKTLSLRMMIDQDLAVIYIDWVKQSIYLIHFISDIHSNHNQAHI